MPENHFSVELSMGISVNSISSRGVPLWWYFLSKKQNSNKKRVNNIMWL